MIDEKKAAHSMQRNEIKVSEERPESVAILIHGTFAGEQANSGKKWWQHGSPTATQLEAKLPEGIRVARDTEVFHWSGENSERGRSKAAAELLLHLDRQEAAGLEYHLVGHSHGGSVIWNALKMATIKRQPLDGLRSWTTVGTPFLQHRSRSAWNLWNLLGIVVGVLLLRPAFNAGSELGVILWDAAMGEKVAMQLRPDEQIGYMSVLRAPILAGLERMGVPIERTDEFIQLGQFDPAGDVSLIEYLFASTEGLLLLTAIIVVAYVFLHLSLLFLRPPLESYRVRAEEKLNRRTFKDFGAGWLGIWSPDDEAINGLRATLDITVSFIAKMQPRERIFISDAIAMLSRPYFWVLAPIFNRLIHPAMDAKVRGIVTRSAQGNDRPMATVVDVTPCPLAERRQWCPSVPGALNDKLLSYADQHARDIGPKLRRLLAQPSFTSGIEAFSRELTGNELVHTSYFEHSEILDLISCNVALGNGQTAIESHSARIDPKLLDWFAESKSLTFGGRRDSRASLRAPSHSQRRAA